MVSNKVKVATVEMETEEGCRMDSILMEICLEKSTGHGCPSVCGHLAGYGSKMRFSSAMHCGSALCIRLSTTEGLRLLCLACNLDQAF